MYKRLISLTKHVSIIFIFLSCCLLNSCSHNKNEDGNDYFYNIGREITSVGSQQEKIKILYERELKKYKETKDLKYLISSNYLELFLFTNLDKQLKDTYKQDEQLRLTYELLKLNANEYDYITISCNFNMALHLEKISPQQSLRFLNMAIKIDEKTGKRFFLPHLYHMKGRLYFNKEKYEQAIFYFKKAKETYIVGGVPDDVLYIASMYNNMGMCYDKMNNTDLAIKKTAKGIEILEKKQHLTLEDQYFINYIKGNLGSYFFKKENYKKAEELLLQQFEFCKDKEQYYHSAIIASQKLVDLYNTTHETDKKHIIINFLKDVDPKLKYFPDRIAANEILQDHYADINDLQSLKIISNRLKFLHNQQDDISEENLSKVSDMSYNYVIENINQEYDFKIASDKKRMWFLSSLILLIILFSIWIVINLRNRSKREKELIEKQKIILENNKTILEQDIYLHKEKIKNLNLNLNLKIETEKAFLENLKKIRRSKNIDIEQTLKDLFFKINNLIEIDKKNYDFINESSLENKMFTAKLSEIFPSLTEQELKLCVYFKLNLSSKEVSLLENITSGSVRVYKTKIKSKMGISKEMDLNSFLKGI